VKYAFIAANQGKHPVETMCTVLGVSPSGFYDWRNRGVSGRLLKRQSLLEEIKKIYNKYRGRYGAPRIFKELCAAGIACTKRTVEELMRENGIRAKRSKKFKATTDSNHNLPVAPNRLKRKFKRKKPNKCWVSDITYIHTEEGWLYLAVFIDLFSRKVVGWSMAQRMTADLVVNAFRMGIFRQHCAPRMVHSDRGSQYASQLFRDELKLHGCLQSMSKKGDCWDNAVAESFFGALKCELVHDERFNSREAAKLAVFDYIETFYNRERRHSHLGYVSPEEFENGMDTAG
jgi:transposase InsO family protein